MAEYLEFVCKNCGWSICAPAEGSDVNMDSIVAYFKCLDCNKVFGRSYDMGSVVNDPAQNVEVLIPYIGNRPMAARNVVENLKTKDSIV